MKRVLLLLPLLALASCSYPSKQEAEIACYEWASKGGEYIYIDRDHDYDWEKSLDLVQGKISRDEYFRLTDARITERPRDVRRCVHEKETRQYIGWDNGKKAGEKYTSGAGTDRKIVRRFRY